MQPRVARSGSAGRRFPRHCCGRSWLQTPAPTGQLPLWALRITRLFEESIDLQDDGQTGVTPSVVAVDAVQGASRCPLSCVTPACACATTAGGVPAATFVPRHARTRPSAALPLVTGTAWRVHLAWPLFGTRGGWEPGPAHRAGSRGRPRYWGARGVDQRSAGPRGVPATCRRCPVLLAGAVWPPQGRVYVCGAVWHGGRAASASRSSPGRAVAQLAASSCSTMAAM